MNLRRFFIGRTIGFIIVVILVGLYFIFFSNSASGPGFKITDDKPEITEPTEVNPVSILGLAEKNYDGRNLKLGEVLADNSTYTRYYIEYLSGDLTISGIMNVPKGEGPFPVLILNHGYIDPAIYTNGRGLKREQDYLASRGYVVIHPDYRNHASSSKVEDNHLSLRLGYTEDVINAVYAVKESNLRFLDKNNIGMLGHSMGGGITLNIITAKPDLVKATVLFAPVSADYRDNFNKWTRDREDEASDIISAYGEFEDNQAFWDEISPINYLDRIQTPIMLHHGTEDESVPLEWSDKLDQAMRQENKPITYYVYPDERHEFINEWPIVMQRTNLFFETYLKNPS